MQVTHVQDNITHAVIGGKKSIEFGISDSPEFFQILSSTLYSDQMLAVVREVMCNAWDAHIAAGCTDRAVSIQMDMDKLGIRDYGLGIHADDMGSIYGTYGNSTKKNDGTQTGGFGLGCKAPFAYTEHFQVVSHHAGTKTIYAISKSSAERNGKPGITPIASFPTTETGLTVTIPIRRADYGRFKDLIHRIARNGEMNVVFNGVALKTLPFSLMEKRYMLVSESPTSSTADRICVRYGNVIYPVECHKDYESTYQSIKGFLTSSHLGGHHTQYYLILQAPPHSIAVTPSRESLSMQEHTIETLGLLLKEFHQVIKKDLPPVLRVKWQEHIEKVGKEGFVGRLLSTEQQLPKINPMEITVINATIMSLDALATQCLQGAYPDSNSFRLFDLNSRLTEYLKLKPSNRGHIEQALSSIKASFSQKKVKTRKWSARTYAPHEWFKKRIVRPLVRDLQANALLDPKRLYVYDYIRNSGQDDLCDVAAYRFRNPVDYIPILRKVLVLTRTKKGLRHTIPQFSEMKKLGDRSGLFVYHAPNSEKRVAEAKAYFTSKGFTVLDTTIPTPAELEAKAQAALAPPVVKVPRKPRPVGYPALSGYKQTGRMHRIDNCFLEGSPRVLKPKFYLAVTRSRADHRSFEVGPFHGKAAIRVAETWGAECALVYSEPQREAMEKAEVMEFSEFIMGHVLTQISTAPQFVTYWGDSVERALGAKNGVLENAGGDEWSLNAVINIPQVRTVLGLSNSLNDSDLVVLYLWRDMVHSTYRYRYMMDGEKRIKAATDLIEKIPLSQTAKDIAGRITNNYLLKMFSASGLNMAVTMAKAEPNTVGLDKIADVFKLVL